jgi:pimeloyl-ACP methyl ester carboxylesterase
VPVLHHDGALHYDDIGEGPPVVLLHGVTSTGALEWRGLVGTLADDYRCVTPDLRGHGRSEVGTRALSIATLVDDLVDLCDELAISRPHLVGFSMGSHAVLRAALSRPELPASLTFIGFSSGPPGEHSRPAVVEPPDDWPPALRRVHQHGDADHWRKLYSELSQDWMALPEVEPSAVAALDVPTLVILGEGEPEFKHRQARELVAAVPRVRYEMVPGGDHPIHQQQAHTVNRMVRSFIDAAEQALASDS